jgi:hypothetical protein
VKEIDFTDAEIMLIKEALVGLNKTKKLTEQHLSLCEIFEI